MGKALAPRPPRDGCHLRSKVFFCIFCHFKVFLTHSVFIKKNFVSAPQGRKIDRMLSQKVKKR